MGQVHGTVEIENEIRKEHVFRDKVIEKIINLILVYSLLVGFVGCNGGDTTTSRMEPAEYYAKKLKDSSFKWNGPKAKEYRISVLHGARALAFLGDAGVPFQIDAIEDHELETVCIYDALRETGIPVD